MDFTQVINFISTAISAVSGWFVQIFTKSGGTAFYLVMMFVLLTFRFLIYPIMGHSGSDKHDSSKDKDDE